MHVQNSEILEKSTGCKVFILLGRKKKELRWLYERTTKLIKGLWNKPHRIKFKDLKYVNWRKTKCLNKVGLNLLCKYWLESFQYTPPFLSPHESKWSWVFFFFNSSGSLLSTEFESLSIQEEIVYELHVKHIFFPLEIVWNKICFNYRKKIIGWHEKKALDLKRALYK